MTRARLIATRTPRRPRAVVLVLHGGGARRAGVMVSPAQLSVLRMVPIAWRLALAGRRRLAVFRLLNSHRGWDTSHTPVDDVRWALGQLAPAYDGLPVALVGHSLGGRAALLAGDAHPVRSVVALNPWVVPSDDAGLRGRDVLVVHGTADRIASPQRSLDLARRLLRAGTPLRYLHVEGARHAMLRRGGVFGRAAASFVGATLLGRPGDGPVGRLLAGEAELTV